MDVRNLIYSFAKTIRSYLSMPNFKSISFKMVLLQGDGQNLSSPFVCYPKDPMWNKVKVGTKSPLFENSGPNWSKLGSLID